LRRRSALAFWRICLTPIPACDHHLLAKRLGSFLPMSDVPLTSETLNSTYLQALEDNRLTLI
jgi:hypothetical protein